MIATDDFSSTPFFSACPIPLFLIIPHLFHHAISVLPVAHRFWPLHNHQLIMGVPAFLFFRGHHPMVPTHLHHAIFKDRHCWIAPSETPLILILRCLIALSMESRVLFLAWAFFRLCLSCVTHVLSWFLPDGFPLPSGYYFLAMGSSMTTYGHRMAVS